MGKSELIELEYTGHPAYSFQEEAYSVDLSKVAAFDKAYNEIIYPSKTGERAHKDANEELVALVSEIFDEMRRQAKDDYERCFLDELESATVTLLIEEINYYQLANKQRVAGKQDDAMLQALKKDKCFFGSLGKEASAAIVKLSSDTIDLLRERASQGRLIREDLSINSGPTVSKICSILNQEFASQGVLDAVSLYMGRNYYVGGLALELSTPSATWWRNTLEGMEPPKTMYAHLDEGINYPKAIVYVSDVDETNGPTCCYPGVYESLRLNALQELIGRILNKVGLGENSILKDYYGKAYHQVMSSERFRQHFMKLPSELRFNSHFGWDVLPGSDIEKRLLDHQKTMLGESGTFIVFDGGRLLHRGGLIESGERVALQVIFSPAPSLVQRILSLPRRVIAKFWRLFR